MHESPIQAQLSLKHTEINISAQKYAFPIRKSTKQSQAFTQLLAFSDIQPNCISSDFPAGSPDFGNILLIKTRLQVSFMAADE